MLGDKAYDSAELREKLDERGTKPVIPNRCNRKQPFSFSKRLYKLRWRIETAFNRLKDFRRIATRYDKLARNYLASVCLAADTPMVDLISLEPSTSGRGQGAVQGAARNPASSPAILRNALRIPAIADDLRPNEDEELGALRRPKGTRKRRTEDRDHIEPRDSAAAPFLPLTHQAAEQNRLPACDRDRAPYPTLRHGWCE